MCFPKILLVHWTIPSILYIKNCLFFIFILYQKFWRLSKIFKVIGKDLHLTWIVCLCPPNDKSRVSQSLLTLCLLSHLAGVYLFRHYNQTQTQIQTTLCLRYERIIAAGKLTKLIFFFNLRTWVKKIKPNSFNFLSHPQSEVCRSDVTANPLITNLCNKVGRVQPSGYPCHDDPVLLYGDRQSLIFLSGIRA